MKKNTLRVYLNKKTKLLNTNILIKKVISNNLHNLLSRKFTPFQRNLPTVVNLP